MRKVWSALSVKEGKNKNAVRTGLGLLGLGVKFLYVKVKERADFFGSDGAVHRAQKRKVAVGRRSESRDSVLRVGYGLVRETVKGSAGSHGHCQSSALDAARSDGAHHVVAAAGRNRNARGNAKALGGLFCHSSGSLVVLNDFRKLFEQSRVHRVANGL